MESTETTKRAGILSKLEPKESPRQATAEQKVYLCEASGSSWDCPTQRTCQQPRLEALAVSKISLLHVLDGVII